MELTAGKAWSNRSAVSCKDLSRLRPGRLPFGRLPGPGFGAFVTRLACADSLTVECIREHYIATRLDHGLTFEQGLNILEGALAIGRQADVLGPETVKSRMADVQSRATTATLVPDPSLLSTIKGWFGATKQTEAVT